MYYVSGVIVIRLHMGNPEKQGKRLLKVVFVSFDADTLILLTVGCTWRSVQTNMRLKRLEGCSKTNLELIKVTVDKSLLSESTITLVI